MKVINVVGARPNFMKIAPIIRAIKSFNQIDQIDQTNQINERNENMTNEDVTPKSVHKVIILFIIILEQNGPL